LDKHSNIDTLTIKLMKCSVLPPKKCFDRRNSVAKLSEFSYLVCGRVTNDFAVWQYTWLLGRNRFVMSSFVCLNVCVLLYHDMIYVTLHVASSVVDANLVWIPIVYTVQQWLVWFQFWLS
jgi:hypothetical protein